MNSNTFWFQINIKQSLREFFFLFTLFFDFRSFFFTFSLFDINVFSFSSSFHSSSSSYLFRHYWFFTLSHTENVVNIYINLTGKRRNLHGKWWFEGWVWLNVAEGMKKNFFSFFPQITRKFTLTYFFEEIMLMIMRKKKTNEKQKQTWNQE